MAEKNNVFLIFDYLHLLKNIRNDWITEKIEEREYVMGAVKKVSKWSDITRLYKLDVNNLIYFPNSSVLAGIYVDKFHNRNTKTLAMLWCIFVKLEQISHGALVLLFSTLNR